jgi:hypothetical protein
MSMERKKGGSRHFVAPCGLYCGACSIRAAVKGGDIALLELIALGVGKHLGHAVAAKDLVCEGCLSDVLGAPCRQCAIRDCAVSRGITHCSQCGDFPCQTIADFNNDGMAHHAEVLDNIRRQREVGIDSWLREQQERWRCPACGCETNWYAGKCSKCGGALEGHF